MTTKKELWDIAIAAERAHDAELIRIYGASVFNESTPYDLRANGAWPDAPGNLHALYKAWRDAVDSAILGRTLESVR